ncbi:hypothetical protein F5051DRAFT_480824 [Lentinula edodes]|nr:hypothetical protein F5051DRAFT_480824 [Lentinula edodes]
MTESTMRSLGLREGDIIRSSDFPKVTAPPNLFANGPNGVLKPGRRGRPQPIKSLSSAVYLNTISEVSDKIQRTESPLLLSPVSAGTPMQPPARSSSDALTNRPTSTEPLAPASRAPPVTVPRAPSAPLTSAPAQAVPVPTPPNPPVSASARGPPSLATTTEDDVFQPLARLSELRKSTAPAPAPSPSPITNVVQMGTPSPIPQAPSPPTAPNGYQSGMGMSNSPIPMGQHLQAQQTGVYGPEARGPYVPVPSNQNLLQPLIPTQTGLSSQTLTSLAGNGKASFDKTPSTSKSTSPEPYSVPPDSPDGLETGWRFSTSLEPLVSIPDPPLKFNKPSSEVDNSSSPTDAGPRPQFQFPSTADTTISRVSSRIRLSSWFRKKVKRRTVKILSSFKRSSFSLSCYDDDFVLDITGSKPITLPPLLVLGCSAEKSFEKKALVWSDGTAGEAAENKGNFDEDSNEMTADHLRYALFRHGEIDSDWEKKFLEPYGVVLVQQVMDLFQLVVLLPQSAFDIVH